MLPPKEPQHISGLDGLRAIAATMVFFFHAWRYSDSPTLFLNVPNLISQDLSSFMLFGARGVALFFVLSGFLLSLPFWRWALGSESRVNIADYISRRFFRIYPAYFIAILIYAFFADTNHPWVIRLIHISSHLLLVHNFAEITVFNLSTPLWSVATEFQLYLLLPVIFVAVFMLRRRNSRFLLIVAILFLLSIIMRSGFISFANWLLATQNIDPRLLKAGGHVIDASPLFGIVPFVFGIIAGGAYLQTKRGSLSNLSPKTNNGLTFLFVSCLLYIAVLQPQLGWHNWLPDALFASLVLLVASGWGLTIFGQILDLKPVKFIGTISYSFYLYHDLVLWNTYNRIAHFYKPLLSHNSIKAMIAFGITLALAWLSYRMIEAPFRTWGKSILDKFGQECK